MRSGAGKSLAQTAAAMTICAIASAAAHAQDLYGCGRPIGMPPIPDGSLATITEMQTARESVETFLNESEAFVGCLAKFPDDPVATRIRNQLLLEMDLVVVRFNDQLCVYTDGQECAGGAATDEASRAPGSSAAQPAMGLGSSARDLTRRRDSLGPHTALGLEAPTLGAEDSDLLSPGESPQTSSTWPADSGLATQVEEPSLPDGTPCGSVTQTRNDTTGEYLDLRRHFAWDVYNTCIDAIRVRWTFRGDGILDSVRTIPGRRAQSIGCSTPAGRVTGRYCTGGLEYLFEWP